MYQPQRILIKDVNEYLKCKLCSGYYIDATTIIECLHSFCRSCIVKYLKSNKYCPICDVQVHKSKPFLNIKQDKILQDVVYKLVPKLFHNETERRRQFYAEHPEAKPTGFEKRGESNYEHILSLDDTICISLIYKGRSGTPRYLRCPAGVSILNLKKLIRSKYDLNDGNKVDIFYNQDCLNSYLTLMDVTYIYSWIRKDPLELTYCIYTKVVENENKDGLEGECTPKNENDWKEVQIRISESGEMSFTGIENCLDLIEKDFIKVDAAPNEPAEIDKESILDKPSVVDKNLTEPPVVDKKVDQSLDSVQPKQEKVITEEETFKTSVKIEDKNIEDQSDVKEVIELKILDDKSVLPCDLKDTNENITATINNGKRKLEKDAKRLEAEPSCKFAKPIDVPTTRPSKKHVTIISNCKITSSVIKKQDLSSQRAEENVKLTATEIMTTSSSNIYTRKTTSTTSTANSYKTTAPSIATGMNPAFYDIKLKTKPDVSSNGPDKTPPPNYTPPKSPKSNTKVKNAYPAMCYKTLRDPPKTWNPQISRSAMLKSDGKEETKNLKPAKFFKMRNNMPRYLGNPASGVKPMYQLHAASDKDKDAKSEAFDFKKHSILKIDPKTLKPISDKAPEAPTTQSDLKINTSSVSIFSPLKLHSAKSEAKSPSGKKASSPPAKRDKLNVSCTPSNPFIPNLSSPTMNPNQFLYPPGFSSYDPRIMVYSYIYGQQQLPFHSPLLSNINSDSALRKYDIPQASNSKNNYRGLPETHNNKNQTEMKQKPVKKEYLKNDKTLESALEKISQNKKKVGLKQDESFKINNLVRENKPDVYKENLTSGDNMLTQVDVVSSVGEDSKVLIKTEGGGEVVQKINNTKDDVNNIATTCDNKGSVESLSKTERNSILENCTTDNVKNNVLSESDTKKF